MLCNFEIGIAKRFENAELLSVGADIVFHIKEQHHNGGCDQTAARNAGDHAAHHHLSGIHRPFRFGYELILYGGEVEIVA